MACTAHVVRASYHCTEERLKKQEKELKKKRRAEEEARRKAEEARTRAEAMANASYITPMHEIIGKLVEIHSLKHDKYAKLNGCKGRIQGAEGSRWLVHIFNLKTTKAVKAENLYYLDEEWCKTTHVLSSFDQNAMIHHFGAPGRYPPKLAELKDIRKLPSLRKLLDFWGENVYEYMVGKLDSAMKSAASSNKGRGLFWHFETCNRKVALAMVFSDGSKSTQHAPLDSCAGSMFWPVLVPMSSVEILTQSTCNLEWLPASQCTTLAIPTWCQAQALTGSRPYLSHPERIFILISMPVEVPEPGLSGDWVNASTVTIEEHVESDDNGSEAGDNGWDLVNAPTVTIEELVENQHSSAV